MLKRLRNLWRLSEFEPTKYKIVKDNQGIETLGMEVLFKPKTKGEVKIIKKKSSVDEFIENNG